MGQLGNIKIAQMKYSDVLPSTGAKIKITPFRVGDEKVLLEASSSNDVKHMYDAVKRVVENCVEGIDIDEIENYDLEYLFLRLRVKSVGETSKIGVKCEKCEVSNEIDVDLDKVKVVKNKNHSSMVKIQEDLAFEMKIPKDEFVNQDQNSLPEIMMQIILNSIKKVYHGEEVIDVDSSDQEDLRNLIESMNKNQFEKIQQFFETIPKLSHQVSFECGSCGEQNEMKMEGLQTFLS